MFIECFVKKSDDSDVFVDFEGVRYIFTKNQLGKHVCFVGNMGHQRRLLSMGPAAYKEYFPPADMDPSFQPGSTAIPLGGSQARPNEPEATDPLPDNLTVDEGLAQGDEGADPPAAPVEDAAIIPPHEQEKIDAAAAGEEKAPVVDEVKWAPEAVDTKINEFKFLEAENFKTYVNANRDRVMTWPVEVRAEVAKKLNKKFPDLDPGIEGFVINDYLGSGNTGDS